MRKIFVSYSFREPDRSLATQVERILRSHQLQPDNGSRLAGGPLTQEVTSSIEACDGLVALLTRRETLGEGRWTTHNWVRDELNHARSAQMPAIALLENGVEGGGAYAEHERIPYSRDAPLEAFLALSETIGLWKYRAGRRLKIQILPTTLAEEAALAAGECRCRYRFVAEGQYSDWQVATQIPEAGGTFIYIRGVRDDFLIQLMIERAGTRWQSRAVPVQSLPVELRQAGGDQ